MNELTDLEQQACPCCGIVLEIVEQEEACDGSDRDSDP
jgi:hypothetical protein